MQLLGPEGGPAAMARQAAHCRRTPPNRVPPGSKWGGLRQGAAGDAEGRRGPGPTRLGRMTPTQIRVRAGASVEGSEGLCIAPPFPLDRRSSTVAEAPNDQVVSLQPRRVLRYQPVAARAALRALLIVASGIDARGAVEQVVEEAVDYLARPEMPWKALDGLGTRLAAATISDGGRERQC